MQTFKFNLVFMKFHLRASALVVFITLATALVGSFFSSSGMPWYDSALVQPSSTPPKWVFPIAWNIIFLCTAASAIILWSKPLSPGRRRWIFGLFALNAVLNVLWSYLFFSLHKIGPAFGEMLLLEVTVLSLMILAWKPSKLASLLLLPYLGWIAFATYLTSLIYQLN